MERAGELCSELAKGTYYSLLCVSQQVGNIRMWDSARHTLTGLLEREAARIIRKMLPGKVYSSLSSDMSLQELCENPQTRRYAAEWLPALSRNLGRYMPYLCQGYEPTVWLKAWPENRSTHPHNFSAEPERYMWI
jgi:hypothetical protein